MRIAKLLAISLVSLLVSVLCTTTVSAQVVGYRDGAGGSKVQGGAGTSIVKTDKGVVKCEAPLGALAVVEPQDMVMNQLSMYSLSSPVGLIRIMVQQSNCFLVVERGIAMVNLMQERVLADTGQVRRDSNIGDGQMVAADFVLTPSVVFSHGRAGGIGGFLRIVPVVGIIAGGLKFKEAQTSMLLADARTGIQVAAAEGSTRKADLALGTAVFGSNRQGGVGGYGNSKEGKVIAAAFVDNFNSIVEVVGNDPSLQRTVGSLKQEAAAGGKKKPKEVFSYGDVVVPKIANVRVLAEPNNEADEIMKLQRTDELVVLGNEQNGFLNVQGAESSGWVLAVLVSLREQVPGNQD